MEHCIPEGEWIFRFEAGTGRASRTAVKRPSLPFARPRSALRLRPRKALSSGKTAKNYTDQNHAGNGVKVLFSF